MKKTDSTFNVFLIGLQIAAVIGQFLVNDGCLRNRLNLGTRK